MEIEMIDWISGDGGPTIVIQSSVIKQWKGAEDFDNSLMNGGEVETDYDVICECTDGVNLIHRYERDMLVLSDCEWVTSFYQIRPDVLAVIQVFGSDKTEDELIMDCFDLSPSCSFTFTMEDPFLRLLVGADSGDGSLYGFSNVALKSGLKQCDVYFSDDAQIVLIREA